MTAAPAPATLASQRARLLRLAWPIMLSNVTVPLVGAADVYVIGHQPDAALLAGLAFGTSIFNFTFFAFNFLKTGVIGMTAQAAGASDLQEAAAILYRAVGLSILIGAALILLRPLIVAAAFSASDADPGIEAAADAYLTIRFFAGPATLLQFALVGWLWGRQDMRSTLLIQVATNAINITLDLWFVLDLGWGVEGAAAASVVAEWSGVLIGFAIVRRKLRTEDRPAWPLIAAWPRVRRMLQFNRDVLIRTVALVGGLLLFRAEANGFGAADAAAVATLFQVFSIVTYAIDGFSNAVNPMVGEAVGRRNPAALKTATIAAFQAGGLTAFVITGFLLLAMPDIVRLFTDIPAVLAAADVQYVWPALMPLVTVWCFLMDGMFLGAGLNVVVRNAMLQATAVYLLLLYGLPPLLGLDGLWIAVLAFGALRAGTLALNWSRLLGSASEVAKR